MLKTLSSATEARAPRWSRRRRDAAVAAAELVLEIASSAATEVELLEILRTTLGRLRVVIRLTGGSINLVDGDEVVCRAAIGPFADEALGQRLKRGASRTWQVIDSGEPFVSGDLQGAGLRPIGRRAATQMRSWLGVPITRGDARIGVLEVDSTRSNAFGAADVDLLAKVARALSGSLDLAERYAAERRRRLLQDAYVGVISHELRTPITTIYGLSKILRDRFDTLSAAARAEAVADIEAEADRLRRLADNLMVLSRAGGGTLAQPLEPILLSHIVRRAADQEAERWPGRRFSQRISEGLPPVLGDQTYAEQVTRNLLSNAAKYSPEGALIEVVVERTGADVCVRVLDEGIGLDSEETSSLFEPFVRSAVAVKSAPGAGIGLFVCRQLVELMGGRIWAQGRDERGAEFGFALRVATEGSDDVG